MTRRRLSRAVVVAVVLGASLAAVPAASAATPSATLELRRAEQVLWAEAVLGQGEATTVRITFWAPRKGSERRDLWQSCRFPFGGAGMYRCGIDVSPGSPAAARRGEWLAKVAVDGEVLAKRAFRL